VFETGSPDGRSAFSQCVRFSFEATTLRQAVSLAGELRRVSPEGVRVRPARVSGPGLSCWAVHVTTPPMETGGIAALEDELRRIAWRAPGIRLTGWLHLSGSVESLPKARETGDTQAPVGVLIVDDSPSFRRTARELLERRGYSVVGEADTAAGGIEAVERLRPAAVLLDVRLPDGSGLDVCEVLARAEEAPAVLLVSSDARADSTAARSRGARAFVPKADLARVDLAGIWG
jgi:CheY-like chemotaxis protein